MAEHKTIDAAIRALGCSGVEYDDQTITLAFGSEDALDAAYRTVRNWPAGRLGVRNYEVEWDDYVIYLDLAD